MDGCPPREDVRTWDLYLQRPSGIIGTPLVRLWAAKFGLTFQEAFKALREAFKKEDTLLIVSSLGPMEATMWYESFDDIGAPIYLVGPQPDGQSFFDYVKPAMLVKKLP